MSDFDTGMAFGAVLGAFLFYVLVSTVLPRMLIRLSNILPKPSQPSNSNKDENTKEA